MKSIVYIYMCIIIIKEAFLLDPCEEHKSCDLCIRDTRGCVWCAKEEQHHGPRCILEKSIQNDWCNNETRNPTNTIVNLEERDFSSELGNIVQIKPQKYKMELRPGKPLKFKFSIKTTLHYPVDLYFLFDASKSMRNIQQQAAEQTEKLYQLMQNITSNVYLGLGTFVDKNALPFTDQKNNMSTYSFMHHLQLTNLSETFKSLMGDMAFGYNVDKDNAKGGLDALAQAIVCNEIGWRNESRKIVIFVTDGAYHAAGDGKWAGIIEPYDGGCYIKNQRYTKELEMDYPSIGIINKLASEAEVKVIFLIPKEADVSSYRELSEAIKGAEVISFDNDLNGKGIATILSEHFEAINQLIQLKVQVPPSYAKKINISFKSDCAKNNFKCIAKYGRPTEYVGTIEILEYFKADKIKVDISIQGLKEKLSLDIKLISECDCKDGNDTLCKGNGKRRCGICECNANWDGEYCECSKAASGEVISQDKSTCIAPNSTIECSGRGVCLCGSCKSCDKRYHGKYCECDTESCPRDKNGICGGHGDCYCGECKCKEGWLQTSNGICNCLKSTEQCRTGPNFCFGHGNCICGACKCPATNCEWDARSAQDSRCLPTPCPDCHGRQCQLLEPYALAVNTQDGPCKKKINITTVKELTVDWADNSTWLLCENIRADVGCYTKFVYKYDDVQYGIHLIVQSESNCAESYYIYGGTCLGALIVTGVLTLVAWKLLTEYRYRREYNQFCKSHGLETSQHTENPFFNAPSTTFSNPRYRKQSLF